MSRFLLLLVGAGVLACMSTSPAAADAPPAGYQFHCRNHHCPSGGAPSVEMTEARLAVLEEVNKGVNRKIRYVADEGEDWRLGVTAGDCEEYALAKQHELIARGFPPASLRLATVRTRGGVLHAILVAKTSAGDLVLDNRRAAVLPFAKTGYQLEKIATADPLVWWSPRKDKPGKAKGTASR